jgi:hypothetical protein
MANPVCPRCGFTLIEEGRRIRRPPRALARTVFLAAVALAAAVAAAFALPAAFTPASTPISGAEVEGLLALRYPKLRESEHAVIACPRRRIQPGGETLCWILARVGQQRSVVVRLSPRGNAVEIDD